MPLTRHLYREDEVQAALMFCILRGRCTEAAFWCMELLDSGLERLAQEALLWMWLYGYCLTAPRWLEEKRGGDSLVAAAVGLSRVGKRDTSILAILGTPLKRAPDPVNAFGSVPPFEVSGQAEVVVWKALRQGKTRTAWACLNVLTPELQLRHLGDALAEIHGEIGQTWCSLLQKEMELGHFPRPALVAALVAFCCLKPEEGAKRWGHRGSATATATAAMPQETAAAIEEWKVHVGRRSRRAYCIPQDCLFWITVRGRDITPYDTNEKEIIGQLDLKDSEYWKACAEACGGWEVIALDDMAREEFYDAHFPDDIPDEWSRAERQKSHGSGRGRRAGAEGVAAVRWIRVWFGGAAGACAVVWNGFETACRELEARWEGPDRGPISLRDMWTLEVEEDMSPVPASWDMTPIRRVVVAPET